MSEENSSSLSPQKLIWKTIILSALTAGILFSLWPEIDLYTSALFYQGKSGFVLVGNPLGTIPRMLFRLFFISFCGLTLIGLIYTHFKQPKLWGFARPHFIYLVACLIIGPGILTNSILKDHWGRARPIQTEQFGSSGKFTPALVPSNACARNCSFVSGESSSIFMVFFSLALLLAKYRTALFTGGLIIGGLAGLVRMGMGGHFLSDVTFSGIFMLATAVGLHWLLLARANIDDPEDQTINS